MHHDNGKGRTSPPRRVYTTGVLDTAAGLAILRKAWNHAKFKLTAILGADQMADKPGRDTKKRSKRPHFCYMNDIFYPLKHKLHDQNIDFNIFATVMNNRPKTDIRLSNGL